MRPIYLEMNAFGPYAGRQIIDFRELKKRNLFLICGPTGAGKTTILDAMCYSLYGDTSGNERSGATMRSKFAADAEQTYVKFEFAIGQKLYRIIRYPQQYRRKKRGEGFMLDQASATLTEIDEKGSDLRVIATKNVETSVNDLLGFKSDQFRQVVLLPQGDFRKLLLANSTERQGIMQVLFNTQRYGRFQELLRERHDKIKEDNEEINKEIARILKAVQVENEEQLAQRRSGLSEHQQQAEEHKLQAMADRDAYQKIVTEAKVLATNWQTLKKGRQAMAELQEQAGAIAEKEAYSERLKKAQLLAEPCKNLDDIQTQGIKTHAESEVAATAASVAMASLQKAQETQSSIDMQETTQKADTAQLIYLQGLVEKVRHYAEVEKQYTRQQLEKDKLTGDLQQLTTDITARKEQLAKSDTLQEQLQQQLIQQETRKTEIAAVTERVAQETGIDTLQKKVAAGQEALQKDQAKLAQLTEQATQDRVDYEAVQAAFLKGQASLLAQDLGTDEPCPVCGSTRHPQLAVLPENLPQKTDVDRRKSLAEASEQKRQRQQMDVEAATATLKEQNRQLTELRQQYPAEGTLADWQQRLTVATQQEQEEQQKLVRLQKEVAKVKELTEDQKKLESRETELRTEVERARIAFAAAEATMKQAAAEVPKEYLQDTILQQVIQTLIEKVQKFEQARKMAQDGLRAAETENAKCQEKVRSLTEQVESFRQQYSAATAALKERVIAAGFGTVRECRDLQREVPKLPLIEKEVADYREKVQLLAGRIQQAEHDVADTAEPDMAAYEKTLEDKNKSADLLTREAAELKQQYDTVVKSDQEITAYHNRQGTLTEQYKSVGSMFDLVSGKSNGGVNFERYVLGALLDDVLTAANERLNEMSRQRYQLQRSQEWADKRKTFGLDIDVFDNYTGYARPANTLSGGETFLASLSLALGLADVVQAYSGGIHLDTIFIDEGFGTLDSDALDFALKTLLDLERGGRLVGIISHVPELRERIDAQLVIKKTDRGSTAAFELL